MGAAWIRKSNELMKTTEASALRKKPTYLQELQKIDTPGNKDQENACAAWRALAAEACNSHVCN